MEAILTSFALYVFLWFLCAIGLHAIKVAWTSFVIFTIFWIPTFYGNFSTFHYVGYYVIPVLVSMIIYKKLQEERIAG